MWPFDKLRSDSENDDECDKFDHDYGPWTDVRWDRGMRKNGDTITLLLGFTMRRECRDCGERDTYWYASKPVAEIEINWFHGEIMGSEAQCGLPQFKTLSDNDD